MLAVGLATSLTASARAATIVSYVGPNNGQWNTASYWSPAGVPANSGTNQFTVTVASNSVNFNLVGTTTINNLLLSNSLQLQRKLQLDGRQPTLARQCCDHRKRRKSYALAGWRPPVRMSACTPPAGAGRAAGARRKWPKSPTVRLSPTARAAC